MAVSGAQALSNDSPDEVIRSFNCKITVLKNGRLDVVETIFMDFGSDLRHGLRRFIPNHATIDRVYSMKIRALDTTCDGLIAPCDVTDTWDDVVMKIGDPERTISGEHTYVVHYQAAGAVLFTKGQPRIYWNATGDKWPYKILHATADVLLPDDASASQMNITAFRGAPGSTDRIGFGFFPKEHKLHFDGGMLAPGQGLTISIFLPAGSISNSTTDAFFWWLQKWWPTVLLPPATLMLMVAIWWFCGRDPSDAQIAGVDWDPPKELCPAEVGTLVDENCDPADIVSTLVDLAVRGYLRIKELNVSGVLFRSHDYMFEQLQPTRAPERALKPYEQMFLDAVFAEGSAVSLSSLKTRSSFCKEVPEVRKEIYRSLTDGHYFLTNPENCRQFYCGIGGIMIFMPILLPRFFPLPWLFGVISSGIIICLMSAAMPARTKKGVDACRQALGFKRFVTKAEKDRIRVLAKDDPTIFGRLLPYAMVLNAADQWAHTFADMLKDPPSWYVPWTAGDNNYNFSCTGFVSDLSSSMRTCASALMVSTSASGSGGSAGGGFGGGGGGSW